MNKQELINIYNANKQKMQPITLSVDFVKRNANARIYLRCYTCAGIIYASGRVSDGNAHIFKPASRALGNINEITSITCPFCGQHHNISHDKIAAQIEKLISPHTAEFTLPF